MTAGELVALSVVVFFVGVIAVLSLVRSCSTESDVMVRNRIVTSHDSIRYAVENAKVDSTTTDSKSRRKKDKSIKKNKQSTKPKQRNYLDEPANE